MFITQLRSITKSPYRAGRRRTLVDLRGKEQVSGSLPVVGESKTGLGGVSFAWLVLDSRKVDIRNLLSSR